MSEGNMSSAQASSDDNDGLRTRYFRTLGTDPTDRAMVRRALARAYQLRNFEIEHYWKRATYFWGFQIAIFAAFGLLWRQQASAGDWSRITVALAGLGFLTAVANTLSAYGSRFWQKNWEKHIDMLEDTIEGRLYKTVWLDNGTVSFSVSRINTYLSIYFIVFWILAFFYVAWKFTGSSIPASLQKLHLDSSLVYAIIIFMMMLLGGCLLWFQRTNLSRGIPVVGNTEAFIRRHAPDES